MPKPTYPTARLLTASALAVMLSACGPNPDVAFLPPAPAQLVADQQDARPAYPLDAGDSEAAHEAWVDDALDWGDRRDLQAKRWCALWNTYAAQVVECE